MSPADRLPPIPPSLNSSSGEDDKEPHLYPRAAAGAPPSGADRELDADAEPPFAAMPDVSDRELQADTLAFETIGRRKPRQWGWLKLLVVLCVLGGGAYAGWRQWGDDMFRPSGDEIETVRAPDGQFKIRPDSPGGVEIPNRDKNVYDLIERDKIGTAPARTENLLPRAETPLAPPVAESDESSPQMTVEPGKDGEADETKMVEAKPETADPKLDAKTEAKPEAAPAPAPAPAPMKVTPTPAPPTAARPTPEQVRAAAVPPPPPPPPAVKTDEQLAAASAVDPARAYKIQLGAVRDEAAARKEWDRLRKGNDATLGRLSLNVQRADLGSKGIYYRIQAGPFADRAAAEKACQDMTKQKIPCLIVRPES